jgi:transmembrane sensor
MKTTEPFQTDELLVEIAAAWLVEREEGFLPERSEAFEGWCRSDPRHKEAVLRVEGTLSLLSEMPSVRSGLEWRLARTTKGEFKSQLPRTLLGVHFGPWASGLAAAAALCAAGIWFARSLSNDYRSYSADAFAPQRVALTDGSVVDLNTNTRLQVHFSSGERQIDLAAGEAHFQVAHNAARPFIVTANGVSVRAVGTAFDVRLVGQNVEVLVTEGRVEVDRQTTAVIFPHVVNLIPHLSAGERTMVTPNAQPAPQVENVLPGKVHALLSWQDRMTSFADVPLREMVARVNRCNTTQLVIADQSLAERRIGGAIALDQVDAFVHLLEQDGDITAERRGSEIILRRAR